MLPSQTFPFSRRPQKSQRDFVTQPKVGRPRPTLGKRQNKSLPQRGCVNFQPPGAVFQCAVPSILGYRLFSIGCSAPMVQPEHMYLPHISTLPRSGNRNWPGVVVREDPRKHPVDSPATTVAAVHPPLPLRPRPVF